MAEGKRRDSLLPPPPALAALHKQRSWSPDVEREEAWQRRRDIHRARRTATAAAAAAAAAAGWGGRLSKSVSDEDLEELRGCVDLGFCFALDSPASSTTASSDDVSDRLSDAFPALDLYYAVRRSCSSDSLEVAGVDSPPASSPVGSSSLSIYSPGDSPRQVKTRLKQWAKVVACSVRQHLP
ncbi:unnamed protein product [Spirodela intermedia]|uniref:Uncharacterized protein n=1 Tax=Spirodela intermedia TaxID=51605 RepID=A0A7I8KUB6_SPIIN|nr:unnamed protein product [Spirodela intermedia]